MCKVTTCWQWFLGLGMTFSSTYVLWGSAVAQISPDTTLPNKSNVQLEGKTFNITGGTQAGRNLFHSFQEFSIPTGGTANFNNAADIHNIFSRVTGRSESNIDGLIRTTGSANLFLINPNGIVFGPNASLNVGGSFVATTANAIRFGLQGAFSANNPENPALLTVNPTALLFNQIAAAGIQNNFFKATAELDPTGTFYTNGLSVPLGKSLLLVGGNISMDGGTLNAFGGRVELGGLAGSGTVGLTDVDGMLSLSFPNGVERANVFLSNRSTVKGGNINITAQSLSLTNAALDSRTNAEGNAGNITINTTKEVSFDQSDARTFVDKNGRGNGGDIRITTPMLSVKNNSSLYAATQGQGDAGNIILNARDRVKFDRDSYASTSVEQGSTGKGGDIRINTPTLSLTNGSQLQADTSGNGNAGSVIINADTVQLDGRTSDDKASGIFSRVLEGGIGKGGDIRINTGSLSITNGAGLYAYIDGQGDAGSVFINASKSVSFDGANSNQDSTGIFARVNENALGNGANIYITTDSLWLTNQVQLETSTNGQGNAGKVILEARKSISIDNYSKITNTVGDKSTGNGADILIKTQEFSLANHAIVNTSTDSRQNDAGKAGDIIVNADTFNISNGAELDARSISSPRAGKIIINSKTLTINDDGKIQVDSQGTGSGGNLQIEADKLTLKNQALISAQTESSQGGNILLTLRDFLLLGQHSKISTTATASEGGDAGNITINTPNGFLVALPNGNSDIIANASGSGGKIKITSLRIFNMQALNITAISATSPSLNGEVSFKQSRVFPSAGLVKLPTYVDVSSKLTNVSCAAFDGTGGSSFIVTGRGGLPPSPNEPLSNDVVWQDTRLPATTSQQQPTEKPTAKQPSKPKAIRILPATGWVFNGKGQVQLISTYPNATSLGSTPTTCPGQ